MGCWSCDWGCGELGLPSAGSACGFLAVCHTDPKWWLRTYSQAIFIDNQEDSSRHLFFIYFPPFFGVGRGINQDQGKSNLACHTRRGFTALQELWPQMSGGLYGQIFVLGVTHLGDKKGILEFVASNRHCFAAGL